MTRIKKLRIGDPELPRQLINKMLEKHGVDYDWVMANQEIDGRVWCSHFDWTQQESDEYKKWWIKFFQENVSPRKSKKILEKEWHWFDLMWGLRINNYGE